MAKVQVQEACKLVRLNEIPVYAYFSRLGDVLQKITHEEFGTCTCMKIKSSEIVGRKPSEMVEQVWLVAATYSKEKQE